MMLTRKIVEPMNTSTSANPYFRDLNQVAISRSAALPRISPLRPKSFGSGERRNCRSLKKPFRRPWTSLV